MTPIWRTWKSRLRAPLIVGPMFAVSSPRLVIEACRAGVIGSIPALNARTDDELDAWLTEIRAGVGDTGIPFAVNLITHPTNARYEEALERVVRHAVPLVITSVGAPHRAMAAVKSYGGLVFADVSLVRHARKAAEWGVDGMILLCAGAGGQTGWLNPLAFVEAVRAFYDGALVVAGSITSGRQLAALEMLGADFGYSGTAFIVAEESFADAEYRCGIIESSADDVMETDALTGISANVLEKSAEAFGITRATRWRGAGAGGYDTANIKWRKGLMTAGHGVGAVQKVRPAAAIVDEFVRGYAEAKATRTA